MGDADFRATEPAISYANTAPDTGLLRAGYTQRGKDRRKEHLVVSFQLPPAAADGARLGPLGRWYHETLAHRRCFVWLQGTLSRTIYVLRCVPPHQHSHRTRPPVARISRRRWHQTTLDSEAQLLKSCWPVPERVRLFLPTFPVDERRAHRYAERTYVANGAFGRVYRVRDTLAGGDSRRWYALKVLQKSNIVLSDAVGQVRDEVKIQTVCGHHPFIVPCVDYWQDRTRLFLLSEFFGNGELFHRLKSFTSQLVQLYVAELALAIDFLHNAGIIYRDLKPENVLLDDQFHLKLIDFGLSKWLSVGSRTGTLCGTIQYMAPEILRGEPYGHAVDWWALGVLACRMYTGRYPLMDPAHHLRASVTELPIAPPPSSPYSSTAIDGPVANRRLLPASAGRLPPDGRDLLHRLLEPDPRARLRSLLQLQRIALYQHYRWEDVRTRKIVPRDLFDDECLVREEDAVLFTDF